MTNFNQLEKDHQTFIVDEICSKTGLSTDAAVELLSNDWSYLEKENGHEWTLNALQREQLIGVQPDTINIPEVLIPPTGTPINANAIYQIHELHKLRKGEKNSVEHMILMAILRAVFQGYQNREEAARAEAEAAQSEESVTPAENEPVEPTTNGE